MFAHQNRCVRAILCYAVASMCNAQDWSEAEIIARFQSQSPQVREARARVAVAEADARTRTVLPNPSAYYSREGAGYTTFFQASQTLPTSGRLRYLRDAGAASVSVAQADRDALLWSLQSDIRVTFYRAVAAQERARQITAAIADVEQLIRVLRQRETEGEGSRYDRLRAERELTELRTDLVTAQSWAAAARARLTGFLPEGSASVPQVSGQLLVLAQPPALDALVRRAFSARAEYRSEQQSLTRYVAEEQAALRLRIPEPTITGGVKRANGTSGLAPNPFADITKTALAFSISIPLPTFNRGQYDVARAQAEQEQVRARVASLAHRIRTELQTASDVFTLANESLAAYQRELDNAGTELTRVTQVAYQEGEIGILELLDALRVNRAANLRLLDLQAAAKEAFIELERAVGQEVRP